MINKIIIVIHNLPRWIINGTTSSGSCPICRSGANIDDIRVIKANDVVVVDNAESNSNRLELAKLRKILDNLSRIGISYTECRICDEPFKCKLDKDKHIRKMHYFDPLAKRLRRNGCINKICLRARIYTSDRVFK